MIGIAETIGKYEDIPDIIVDLFLNFDVSNLKIYDFTGGINTPLLSTNGYFLDKCEPDVRRDIIERLIKLQTGEEEIKDYKLIDENDLNNYYDFLDFDSLEKGDDVYEH